jgi:hypothetical protein
MQYKKWLQVLGVLTACFLPTKVYAESINMIRVLCMPEEHIAHFSVYTQPFERLSNYIHNLNGDIGDQTSRLEILKSYGVLFPYGGFEYRCDLPSYSYRIYGHKDSLQAKGMCGGDPRIVLSLEQNGNMILKDVFFESSCFTRHRSIRKKSDYYIKSFSVDGPRASRSFFGIVSDGEKETTIQLENYSLTQDKLSCLGEHGLFDPKTKKQALTECFDNSPQPNQEK